MEQPLFRKSYTQTLQYLKDHPYYCTKPFTSKTYEQDGTVSWCCSYKPHMTQLEFNNADRNRFLQNKPINGCSECYNAEKNGNLSERISDSSHVLMHRPEWLQTDTISHFYIRPSNKCNASCRMCNTTNSSLYDKLTTGNNHTKEITDYTDLLDDIKSAKEIHLFGGETLILDELDIILNELDNDVEVGLNTNCSVFKKSTFDLLERFTTVNFHMSTDGVGTVNDYLRWPSKWAKVDSNINRYLEYNFNFIADPVINIYNVFDLKNVVDYYHKHLQKGKDIVISTKMVYDVDWMDPSILPQAVLDLVYKDMETLKTHDIFQQYPMQSEILLQGIETLLNTKSTHNQQIWEKFKQQTKKWDLLQNCNFQNSIPTLYNNVLTYL